MALMIFDSFMNYFDMCIELSFLAKFFVTDLALMFFDSFMDGFNMSLEVS